MTQMKTHDTISRNCAHNTFSNLYDVCFTYCRVGTRSVVIRICTHLLQCVLPFSCKCVWHIEGLLSSLIIIFVQSSGMPPHSIILIILILHFW